MMRISNTKHIVKFIVDSIYYVITGHNNNNNNNDIEKQTYIKINGRIESCSFTLTGDF